MVFSPMTILRPAFTAWRTSSSHTNSADFSRGVALVDALGLDVAVAAGACAAAAGGVGGAGAAAGVRVAAAVPAVALVAVLLGADAAL